MNKLLAPIKYSLLAIVTIGTIFDELQSKYTKLLVFGVVASNERLKGYQ